MRIALLVAPDGAVASRFTEAVIGRGHQATAIMPPRFPMPRAARHYEDDLGLIPLVWWQLLRREFDVVHAFSPAGAWAAVRALGRPPLVFSLDRAPDREFLVARHFRLEMLRTIVTRAVTCTVPDEEAAHAFERYLLRRPDVVGGPASTSTSAADAGALAARFERIYSSVGGSRQ